MMTIRACAPACIFAALVLPVLSSPARSAAVSDYLVDVWDTDRGLPNYSALTIAQTPDGYLWVGTYAGLARFDGVQFKVIEPANTPGFPGRTVLRLYVDRKGWLWASTEHGLACLRNNKWTAFGMQQGWPFGFAQFFYEDHEGNLFAGAQQRLFRFTGEGFVEVPNAHIGTTPAAVDGAGNFWSIFGNAIGGFQDGQWKLHPLPESWGDGPVLGMGRARDGGILVASRQRVYRLRRGIWSAAIDLPKGMSFGVPTTLLEDSEGNIWVGDYVRGLDLCRKDGSSILFTRKEGLPNLAIRALFEDAERNIWVGTDGGGLARLRPRPVTVFDEASGLPEIITDSVAEVAPGRMLVSTYGGGLVEFDSQRQEFGPAFKQPGFAQWNDASLVLSILPDPGGASLISVVGRGIFTLSGKTIGRIPGCEARHQSVWAIYRGADSTLWIGGEAGLASCRDGVLTRYLSENGLTPGTIEAIAEDGEGRLWVGGSSGLFVRKGERFEKFVPQGMTGYSPISALFRDKSGVLWIGSRDNGLDRMQGNSVIPVFPALGLPAMRVASMLEDNAGRLWVGLASQGLLAIGRESLDAVAGGQHNRWPYLWLNKEDGLTTNNFRAGFQPSACKASDGRLWFATLKGVAVVDPANVSFNLAVPPVWIEGVSLNGRFQSVNPAETISIDVPAGNRRVRIDYTGLEFAAPRGVHFQYRMDGLDPNWQDTGERSVTFPDLRPGDYVFRVRAAANNGLWNQHEATLALHLQPFVWEASWFWALTGLSLVAATATLVNRAQKRKLMLGTAQLARERSLREDLEKAQAVLRNSEERFSKAFRLSPIPMVVSSLENGKYVDANESFLRTSGYSREEVVHHTREELRLWADPDQLSTFLSRVVEGVPIRDMVVAMRSRNGHLSQHLVSAERVELQEKPCLLVVSKDITERTRLEEQLSQAQRLESVGRLAGGVAHDFNNLLTIINGYSDLLLRSLDEGTAERTRVQQIFNAGTRAAELTRQLLAFSRKQVIEPSALNLNHVVAELAPMLHPVLREDIEIVLRLSPDLGQVMADPGQTHQVLMNLAVNARDSMPRGGRLIIETSNVELTGQHSADDPDMKPGKYVLLAVSDTGDGMTEEVRRHIFEPFFTTKAKGHGTGLGLATVYGIVRQNGGNIWVYSEVGRGATFKIYLPRVDTPALGREAASAAAERSGRETVLLVEDQDDVRRFASEALTTYGYSVIEAAGGEQALVLAQKIPAPLHLLLTDVVMPGLTGHEVAQRLQPIHPECKVLYMSGYSEDVIVHQGVLQSGFAYIAKPFTPDALALKVRETLASRNDVV